MPGKAMPILGGLPAAVALAAALRQPWPAPSAAAALRFSASASRTCDGGSMRRGEHMHARQGEHMHARRCLFSTSRTLC